MDEQQQRKGGVMDTVRGAASVGILGLFIGLVVVAIVLWYVIRKVKQTGSRTVRGTKVPVSGEEMRAHEMPVLSLKNGNRFSFTTWLYLDDVAKYRGARRHIMHVGTTSDPTSGYTLRLMMRENTNEIEVALGGGVTAIVPYLASNRWVHLAVIAQDAYNGGGIMIYVDGQDVTPSDLLGDRTASLLSDVNFTAIGGTLYTGGDNRSNVPFPGYIGVTRVYNYDINVNEVKSDYGRGPVDSWMAKLGLGIWGVRTPVHRIA